MRYRNCLLLALAGHETVTDLIGDGLRALLRNPAAMEELLRYDCPFQFMQRTALEDFAIGGNRVARGERLWLMPRAANRDPAVFPNPDLLDFAHPHHRHIAFGIGIHFRIGPALARLEGRHPFGLRHEWPPAGFDAPPAIMTGYSLPYASKRLAELGYHKAKDLLAPPLTQPVRCPGERKSILSGRSVFGRSDCASATPGGSTKKRS